MNYQWILLQELDLLVEKLGTIGNLGKARGAKLSTSSSPTSE